MKSEYNRILKRLKKLNNQRYWDLMLIEEEIDRLEKFKMGIEFYYLYRNRKYRKFTGRLI